MLRIPGLRLWRRRQYDTAQGFCLSHGLAVKKKPKRPGRKPKKPAPGRIRRALKWATITATFGIVTSFLLILPLRWFDPVTSAFILRDDSGRVPPMFQWVDWEQLGSSAPLAAVAAEDQRFTDHFGIDFHSIQKSLDAAANGERLRGASTITQQLTKNLFLSPSRNLLRKAVEAYLTVVAEICLPKRRILEIYLNVVELGPGIYGVGAASKHFFRKRPDELTDAEAALLAAVLPNPSRLNVAAPSSYVRERQRWIVGQMQRLRRDGWLSNL
jgi:monofunctional biosynthetic peptidoglycan transglycosylase